ncbi:MAG TPA: hypothetical protein VK638_41365 [Edaphobacter sp.]|nr:hypothetical protein [Edaphobacter sp.]
MAEVKAKTAVYLGQHGGYRAEGEVFDYAGPDHKHLEPIDQQSDAKSDGKKTKKGS